MTRRGGPSTVVIKEDSQTMSFDIGSVQGLSARMAPVRATTKSNGPDNTRETAFSEAVKVAVNANNNAIPDSPPAEVLQAMGTAAQAHDDLSASGRGLSFKIDQATGKVVVTVHDAEGHVMFTVPGSKALDIASGGSLDE
jgi:flagellar protein FlaG